MPETTWLVGALHIYKGFTRRDLIVACRKSEVNSAVLPALVSCLAPLRSLLHVSKAQHNRLPMEPITFLDPAYLGQSREELTVPGLQHLDHIIGFTSLVCVFSWVG